MSAIEELDFSAVIRSARIEGALLRSEEKGREEGHAEGHAKAEEEFVLKLLKTDTPQEISEKLEIPLKRVIEIKNGN
jgi:predicted transposase YdaD